MSEVATEKVQQAQGEFGVPDAYLLALNGPQAGTTLLLERQKIKIQPVVMGRGGPKAKVPVDFPLQDTTNRISSVHASISLRLDDNLFVLSDLGSANGTRVNGKFIAGPTPLFPGDTISCGTLDLLLTLPPPVGEYGYFQAVPRKNGALKWEFLEDGEQGIGRLEVIRNELLNERGQPEPPRSGSFCRLTPNHPFYIGRFVSNDLQVLDQLVGRRHAEIRWAGNSYIISDMGAANPALINGVTLQAPLRLNEGDEIAVGGILLRFRAPRRTFSAVHGPAPAKDNLSNGIFYFDQEATKWQKLKSGPDKVHLPANRQILIGRAENNDLRLQDPSVSRRHARLGLENGYFVLTDAGSANGTWVNDTEITSPTILQNGDRVKIGDFYLIFGREEVEASSEVLSTALQQDSSAQDNVSTARISRSLSENFLLAGEAVTLELGPKIAGTLIGKISPNETEVATNHPLRAVSPFNELEGNYFNVLVKHFREVTFKSGQEIAREGQSRGAFFAILDGIVSITRELDGGRSRLVLAELAPGSVYGERTVFANTPFANRLEAKTQVRALILDESVFRRELAQHHAIVSFFEQQVTSNSAANWLKGTLLMQTLSDKTRQSIAGRLRFRIYQKGEILATKGEPCNEFFLIVAGAAQAYSVDSKGQEHSLAVLEEGDTFGDGIGAEDETYPMTVRAEKKVECYMLARADFQSVLQKSGDPVASLNRGLSGLPLGAVLNRIPPFNAMPPQLVTQIAGRMKIKIFKKGEVIAWQGDQSSALYIVRSGQVQMSYRASDGTERKDARLGPGHFFGEASLLRETVHAATVTALEDCELLALFRNKLQEVMALGEGYALGQFFARSVERRFRPKRVTNYRLSEQTNGAGETFYILSNESGENFFQLSDRGYFLWQRMDGDNTISDLALDYLTEFKVLDLEAVSHIVGQLQAAGFLQVPAVNKSLLGEQQKHKRSRIARYLTFRYEIKNVDNLTERLYRYGGKVLFLKPVNWLLLGLMGTGLIAFIYFSFFDKGKGDDPSFLLKPPISIFNSSIWWILLIVALLNFVIHESAHALACKSYGRKVSRGGLGWLYVGPYFFVNTDDIYLENRRARIVVDMAGPVSNAIVGGICCLLMVFINDPEKRIILFQMASVAYLIAFININPLLELDGYYALSNWVEIPSLRKKAVLYVRRVLTRQPHPRPVSPREQKIYLWFALLIPVYLLITTVEFVLWLAQILSGLFAGWGLNGLVLTLLSWGPPVVLALLLSYPLFADLFGAPGSENPGGQKKIKRHRGR